MALTCVAAEDRWLRFGYVAIGSTALAVLTDEALDYVDAGLALAAERYREDDRVDDLAQPHRCRRIEQRPPVDDDHVRVGPD